MKRTIEFELWWDKNFGGIERYGKFEKALAYAAWVASAVEHQLQLLASEPKPISTGDVITVERPVPIYNQYNVHVGLLKPGDRARVNDTTENYVYCTPAKKSLGMVECVCHISNVKRLFQNVK